MACADDKLFLRADGYAWVGEHFKGRQPAAATHVAALPDPADPRWRQGSPQVPGAQLITLSPFYPSGRLGVCVELKEERPLSLFPNHPAFHGCRAWMPVSEASWTPLQRPERARYVVLNGHTLGYLIPELPGQVGVLRCSVLKGGSGPHDGTVHVVYRRTEVRQAELEDFASFRVQPPPCFSAVSTEPHPA